MAVLEYLNYLFDYIILFISDIFKKSNALVPLTLVFIIGSVLIYYFFHILAKRDIFQAEFNEFLESNYSIKNKTYDVFSYVLKYLLLFPLILVIWSVLMILIINLLSTSMSSQQIILFSVSLIASIRICSYFNEDLAIEMSKLLPLTLLMILMVDYVTIDYEKFMVTFQLISFDFIKNYLWYLVLVEWLSRLIYELRFIFKKADEEVAEIEELE